MKINVFDQIHKMKDKKHMIIWTFAEKYLTSSNIPSW